MDAGPRIKGKSIMLCFPHISCSESPNEGSRSDLSCKILAVELVQLQAILHKAVQNYTKDVQAAHRPDLVCERQRRYLQRSTRSIVEKQKAKWCNFAWRPFREKKQIDAWK